MEEHGREPQKNPRDVLRLCVKCNHATGEHAWDAHNSVILCPVIDCDCLSKNQYELYNRTESDDPVNHPSHYTAYNGLEIIDLTEQMNFNRGNAVKYIARAGLKGGPEKELEDLKKAQWYISREISRLEAEDERP